MRPWRFLPLLYVIAAVVTVAAFISTDDAVLRAVFAMAFVANAAGAVLWWTQRANVRRGPIVGGHRQEGPPP